MATASIKGKHKKNFEQFVDPNYGPISEKVEVEKIRKMFQDFLDSCLEKIPDDGDPKEPYLFNSHIGDFCRELDKAKDAFTKGLLAFHFAKKQRKEEKPAEK